jgi:hypothetical protein
MYALFYSTEGIVKLRQNKGKLALNKFKSEFLKSWIIG